MSMRTGNAKPRVLLISTGGTITMTPATTPGSHGGVAPTLTGDDLVAGVPALAEICQLDVVSYSVKPGASITFTDIAEIARITDAALQGEHTGAIIVQGTDTIEETAYALDLFIKSGKPVVVTGAMRSAAAPGADGPANLLAAAITASAPESKGRGVLVVLNDTIHAARRVQKGDTGNPAAFMAPGAGPLGRVVEGCAAFYASPGRVPPIEAPAAFNTPVGLFKVCLDDDGRALRQAKSLGYAGAVIESMGAGHLPEWYADIVSSLAKEMPVVLATRVPAGPAFKNTYGFIGSETDSLARGALYSGDLGPLKSRILLTVLLSNGFSAKDLRAEFERRATDWR